MISADSFVRMAHGKRVCQDNAAAATSKAFPDFHYGIVSDGCSGAPHSEVGSQALVESLEAYLYPSCDFTRTFMAACGRADAVRELRHKSQEAMFATLLCATLTQGELLTQGEFRTAMSGDGFIVFRRRNSDRFEIQRVEYSDNSPPYPYYFASSLGERFRDLCGKKSNTQIISDISFGLSIGITRDQTKKNPWSHGWSWDQPCLMNYKYPSDYDLCLVFSDGLSSFVDEHNNLVPLEDVLKCFLAFKCVQGEFLQRRMTRAFEDATKRGWKNMDDFSVAGISHSEEG